MHVVAVAILGFVVGVGVGGSLVTRWTRRSEDRRWESLAERARATARKGGIQ